jgi:hypothetical protein
MRGKIGKSQRKSKDPKPISAGIIIKKELLIRGTKNKSA